MTFDHNETLEQASARNVRDALMEDIGRGDWTAMLVPAGRRVQARVVAKEAGEWEIQRPFSSPVAPGHDGRHSSSMIRGQTTTDLMH